jgi:benzoylformate decarboxylase
VAELASARALVELLVQEGADVLFGNPGSTELPLMDALGADGRVRYVLGLNEAVALAMADGHGQGSGRLTAVNLHAAPGLGNALGMLFNAKKAGSPLLVTAGQQDQSAVLGEPLLWDDLATLARPLVKWSHEVRRPADLPRALHRAATVALAPPTGPVFLSIPVDVLTADAPVELGAPSRVGDAIAPDPGAVERAAALLAGAERPVVFAGDAVAQRGALDAVVELAELLGAPVHLEDMANRVSFPGSHRLFAGPVARLGAPLRAVLDEHDLLVSIGADLFTLSLGGGPDPVPPGMAVVHLDLDPWQLGKNVPVAAAVLGDPAVAVPALVAATRRHRSPAGDEAASRRCDEVAARLRDVRASLEARAAGLADATPTHPLAVLQALGRSLPADAVVVEESLSSNEGVRWLLPGDDPVAFFGMRGGGIGWGFPAAVGVQLAVPGRPVVAIVGDGGFLATAQAIWTAARERVGVVAVVLDNRSYRILKQRTRALGGHAAATGRYVAMDLVDPAVDLVGMARSFGADAVTASTPGEVVDAVKAGLGGSGPTVVVAPVDPAV